MLVSTNIGGLSNRIKSLVSCLKYAKNKDIDVKVYWKVLNSYKKDIHILNCPYHLLFNNDLQITHLPHECHTYKSHCLLIEDIDEVPNNFSKFESKCNRKFTRNDIKGRNIDFEYNRIPDKIKNKYIEVFKELKPIHELQQKIDNFSQNFGPNTISVHIRSWNRNGEKERMIGLFNISKFEKKMNGYDNFYNFFLSSDSKEVIDYFTKKSTLKDRVIVYDRQTNLNLSREQSKGIQEDLIELYLLSKNKILIGSHFSTFSEVAWWLAGCPQDVTIL